MAPARLRVAAGAGLVAASLTIVGPGVAAAFADPGDSDQGHSRSGKDSGHGNDGDRHGGDRGSSGGGRHDRGDDQHGRVHDSTGDHDGGGRPDSGGKSNAGDSKATDDTEDLQIASRPVSSAVPSNSLVAAQAPQTVPSVQPEVPAAVVGGGGSGGAAQPASVAPTVTFGDGRTPGFLGVVAGVVPGRANPAQAPGPAADDQSSSAPAEPMPTTMLRSFDSQGPEFIDQIWAPLRPAFPGGLVFGIAGLLIAPMAGVWLGYRQARAADAVDHFADR